MKSETVGVQLINAISFVSEANLMANSPNSDEVVKAIYGMKFHLRHKY